MSMTRDPISGLLQKEGTPALFSSQLLHKAMELNSSFIQCHNQFHCLSIARLQSELCTGETDVGHIRLTTIALPLLAEVA